MKPAHENPLTDLALGAMAGAAATWVMGKATTYLYEHEDQQARRREDQARGGSTAYETAAEKAAGFAGRELSKEERKKLGSAIHWTIGISAAPSMDCCAAGWPAEVWGGAWPWALSSARGSGCCSTRRAIRPSGSLPALAPFPGRLTRAAWQVTSSWV